MSSKAAAATFAGVGIILIHWQRSCRPKSVCVGCTATAHAKITISLLPVEVGTIIEPPGPDALLVVSLLPDPPADPH